MDEPKPQGPTAAEDARSAAAAPLIAAARFAPGDLLARRYRIVRTLGEARLDEIYEADDLSRGTRVALRVLNRDAGRGDQGLRRLGRLVSRLARLDHPGVVRVFDLGWHELEGDAEARRVIFVTSEVLRGESLSRRVRRDGPLPVESARAFFTELCGAVDAIHRARLAHGDINGTSVVFAESPGGATRVVVSDFSFGTGEETGPFGAGRVVGSPAYRAPEQLTGRSSGRAADIFSLGAVMYEAITGRLPFTGGNLLALDFRQLEETPLPPSAIAGDIPPAWEATVLRCLERAPGARFDSAREVLRSLDGEHVATPRRRQNVRTFSLTALLIGVMLGGSALLSYVSMLEEQRLEAARVMRTRPSVAVLPLHQAPGSPDAAAWTAIAIQELLRIEIGRDERIRVAPADTVSAALQEVHAGESETLAPAELRRLRAIVGTEQIVVGSWRVVGGAGEPQLVLDLCAQDTRTGETIGAVTESGHPDELVALCARAAERLRANLGIRGGFATPNPIATHGWSIDGLRSYASGLNELEAHRFDDAVRSLDAAVRADPHLPYPRAALSSAFWQMGRVKDAIEEAARAVNESSLLPREDAFALDAHLAELRADWPRAIAVYRQLVRSYPDRTEHGQKLASALIRDGNVDDARRAIRMLRSLSMSANDPRLDLLEARADTQAGRHADALLAARRAAETASAIGARAILAECLTEEAWAQAALGDLQASDELFSRAEAVFAETGSYDELARVATMRATVDQRHRKLDEALANLRRAEAFYERIGQRQGSAATRGSIALLLAEQGRHRGALRLFESAMTDFISLGDLPNARRSRVGLAESCIAVGDLVSAEAQLDEALSSARASGDRVHESLALLGLARVRATRGEFDRATAFLDDADAIFEALGLKAARAEVDRRRGSILRLRGQFDEAGRKLLAAQLLQEQAGDTIGTWEIRVELAAMDLDQGRATQAAGNALSAASFFGGVHRDEDYVRALIVTARAMAEAGDARRASAVLDAAASTMKHVDGFELHALLEAAQASVRRGDPSSLLRIADDAAERGYLEAGLTARLAAAQLLAERGARTRAMQTLDAAEQTASASGAGLFQTKARAIRETISR